MLAGPICTTRLDSFAEILISFCCLSPPNTGGMTYSDTTDSSRNSRESNHSDTSISSDTESNNEPPLRRLAVWCQRRFTQRIFKFTLFAQLEGGIVRPFTFVSSIYPDIPANLYTREFPAHPFFDSFFPSLTGSRISDSFRSTTRRNVKVLIVRGIYKGQHGVIVKSYVLGKNKHRVLTSDGSITTIKQIYLKRLDVQFWLPFGYPVANDN